jgi:ubiquinone/menaquinone biosynthesis C-methylase UbiE
MLTKPQATLNRLRDGKDQLVRSIFKHPKVHSWLLENLMISQRVQDIQAEQMDDIQKVTKSIGDDWKTAPYYDIAEADMDKQWSDTLWPFISDCDFSTVLDLAAGHGRNSEKLRHHAGTLYIADINQENIDFCKQRFGNGSQYRYVLSSGTTLPYASDDSISLIYCFDSMVHFDSDTVRQYLKEFKRILRPGGRAFCHHSNYTSRPTGDFHQNPHWRNFMSKELFEHYTHKEGLRMVRSVVKNWGADEAFATLDCFSLVERPMA